jgi:hypothetical protein
VPSKQVIRQIEDEVNTLVAEGLVH